jgi:SNF2 family DNA or RNA helicase
MEFQFKTEPFAHQLSTWTHSKDRPYAGLMYEMGCGKSKTLLDTIAYLFKGGKINGAVILAPKGCYQDWPDSHIPTHLSDDIKVRVVMWRSGPSKTLLKQVEDLMTPAPDTLDIFVINIEAAIHLAAEKQLDRFLETHVSLMAIDESTSIGNPSAQRTKAMLRKRGRAKYRRILTGDGAPNSPLTLFSQCKFLHDTALPVTSYVAFKRQFCNLDNMYLPGRGTISVVNQEHPYKNLDLLKTMISEFCYIVKKKDCLDLPEQVYMTRSFEMTDTQRRHYVSMREMAIAEIESRLTRSTNPPVATEDELEALRYASEHISTEKLSTLIEPSKISTASIVLTQILRLHQITRGILRTDDGVEHDIEGANPALDALMDTIEESSGSMIVWANYRRNIAQIEARLVKQYGRKSVVTYFGDTTLDARKEAKERFQAGDARFFVANQATGKYGLQLTAANIATFFSNSYDQEARSQAEARNHRIGTKGDCVTYMDIVCHGTVDDPILVSLRDKKALSALISPSNWRQFV